MKWHSLFNQKPKLVPSETCDCGPTKSKWFNIAFHIPMKHGHS